MAVVAPMSNHPAGSKSIRNIINICLRNILRPCKQLTRLTLYYILSNIPKYCDYDLILNSTVTQ